MSDLLKRLKTSGSIKYASILSESELFNDKDVVKTDIPIINIALSGKIDGGITPGLIFLAGPSKTFKSLSGLMMVKAYMTANKDAVCLYYDSEFGITPEYIKSNGIDADRVLHIPIEHLEQLKFDISKRLEEIKRGDKVIIFIDSIGNLASKKEAEDALEEKTATDMTRARTLKSLFRIITPHFTTKDIPCIAINHTYQEMCLRGDTLIKTPEGNRPIKDIQIGDMVYALNGAKKITAKFNPEDLDTHGKKFLKLTFDDNTTVDCTDNHKFLMKDQSWKEAGDMMIGDEFM